MLSGAKTAVRPRQPALRYRTSADDEAGSGTAIGVAIFFPVLMLVIMALQSITSATRTEQSLQAIADRAAHSASLCCLNVGAAQDTVEQNIVAASTGGPRARLDCVNDIAGNAAVLFTDVTGTRVPRLDAHGQANTVPAGGNVTVTLLCRLPPDRVGILSPWGAAATRSAVGVAAVDPGRHRSVPPTP